jgi:hypothetical protein
MSRHGKTAAALAAAILLAAAGGCGGGGGRLSKSEYEAKLQAEGRTLKPVLTSIASTLLRSPLSAAGKLDEARSKLQKAADDIAALKPPANAEADNKKIATTLRRFADILGRIKDAIAKSKAQDVQRLLQEIQTVGKDGQAASKDLEKKGYKIGVFAEG